MLEDTIQEVVERIDRYADRCRNAGDQEGEQRAQSALSRAASARTVGEAQGIETMLLGMSFAGPVVPPKKKSWWRRLFGGGDDDFDNDDS